MIPLLLLFGELILLYLLAQGLTQSVYDLTYLVTRARSVAVMVVMLLNFPGTVIPELSHLFTAEILGVHTGKLTLVPESIQSEEIKAGSVMIAHSDPFRRYLIGLAPLFTGTIVITAISYFLPDLWNSVIVSPQLWYTNPSFYYLLIAIYCLLAVSSSMFSSREDLKGFIPFVITLGIMIGAAYFAGLRIGITGPVLALVTKILDTLTKSLGVVLVFNIAGFILTRLLISLVQRITNRKLLKSFSSEH